MSGFLKKKLFIWVLIVIFLFLFINSPQAKNIPIINSIRPVTIFLTLPVQYVFASITNAGSNFSTFWGNLISINEKYKQLKLENRILKAKISLKDELTAENTRLRTLLNFRNKNAYKFKLIPAKVIFRSSTKWFKNIQIDKGEKDGVRPNMPVVNEYGVVGKIISVEKQSARVMLLTDVSSAIAAIDQKTRYLGIVEGKSQDLPQLKYLLSSAVISEGDLMVTSSMSKTFPPGLPLGLVTKINRRDYHLFQQIEIKPAVNFNRLEEVFVLVR